MSTATNNFFGVLGEDANSVANSVHLPEQPKTAQNTSSRKTDVNPRADPAKARKRPTGAPSNDKVLKENKDSGRSNNRKVPVKEGANAHHSRRAERTDRQPRTARRDTARRERSGWGDESTDPNDQEAGEQIAQEDRAHDAEEDAAADAAIEERKLTLEEFQKLQKEQQAGLNTRGSAAASGAASAAGASSGASASAASNVPKPRKNNTTKGPKQVETLSLGGNVFPALQQSAEGVIDPSRRSRGAERGDRNDRSERRRPAAGDKPARKPRGKKDAAPAKDAKDGSKPKKEGKKAAAKPALNLSNLPKLN